MSATAAGSMASHLRFGYRLEDDYIDPDGFLQPVEVVLRPDSPTSFPPGFLEPQMTHELLKGRSSNICYRQSLLDIRSH